MIVELYKYRIAGYNNYNTGGNNQLDADEYR